MFAAFKKRAIQKHIRRNIANRDVSRRNEPLRKLGFLVDQDLLNDDQLLFEWGPEFGIHEKDIRVLCYLETKDKKPTLRQNQVYHKNFNWKGEVHNGEAEQFLAEPFDVLVGLYNGPNAYMDLMVSASKAHFKVGLKGGKDELCDLILGASGTRLDQIKKELKKYLRVLNKIQT